MKNGNPCKIAASFPRKSIDLLFSLIEDIAYAAPCSPGSEDKMLLDILDTAAQEGISGKTLGRVQTRVNIRNGSASNVGSGLEYALKNHGGTGPASKSQFTVSREKVTEILGRKDMVATPVKKSSDSGNYIRQFDAGETIGKLPVNKGGTETSVITVITDEAGNLVNTFPGTLGRGAQLQ
ncbi:MAG TPA: hypothetical protein VE954_11270 [Oligoflexus sp.]|uniref:hypothetical protein n=1 Tax=Oligoflexus sp. TaxID=1971216 RepID=UPI002D6410FB|nr:hypothetical protein [Oligoflexus sp.]HYX33685.1 hypothetical protein [Oligoflexus sp.]